MKYEQRDFKKCRRKVILNRERDATSEEKLFFPVEHG
jgi:hypothetical protein